MRGFNKAIKPTQDKLGATAYRRTLILKIGILIIILAAVSLILFLIFNPIFKKAQADRLAAQKDYPAALALYEELRGARGSLDSLVSVSLEYAASIFSKGQFAEADRMLAGMAADERFSPQRLLFYWRGRCAEEQGLYQDAAAYFQQCLQYIDAGEKKNGQAKYLEVTFKLAQELEREDQLAQAYQLYDSLRENVPDAARKADEQKTVMLNDLVILKDDFDRALQKNRYADAQDVLDKIEQSNEIYASYFSDWLISSFDFDQMTFSVIREENMTILKALLGQYDRAIAGNDTMAAFAALQEADRINNICYRDTGSQLIPTEDLQTRHRACAALVLGAGLVDELDTDLVGAVSIRLGSTPDNGIKSNLVPPRSAFGLSIVNIKTESTLQIKWYHREIKYLETAMVEVLVLVSSEMAWQPGVSWYTWAEAGSGGQETDFAPGFYVADLLTKNDSGQEEIIGRTYFQITED